MKTWKKFIIIVISVILIYFIFNLVFKIGAGYGYNIGYAIGYAKGYDENGLCPLEACVTVCDLLKRYILV